MSDELNSVKWVPYNNKTDMVFAKDGRQAYEFHKQFYLTRNNTIKFWDLEELKMTGELKLPVEFKTGSYCRDSQASNTIAALGDDKGRIYLKKVLTHEKDDWIDDSIFTIDNDYFVQLKDENGGIPHSKDILSMDCVYKYDQKFANKLMIVASWDCGFSVWNMENLKCLHKRKMAHKRSVSEICFASNTFDKFATSSWDGKFAIWSMETGKELDAYNLFGGSYVCSITPSFEKGLMFAGGLDDKVPLKWVDLNSKMEVGGMKISAIRSLYFYDKENLLFVGHNRHHISVFDLRYMKKSSDAIYHDTARDAGIWRIGVDSYQDQVSKFYVSQSDVSLTTFDWKKKKKLVSRSIKGGMGVYGGMIFRTAECLGVSRITEMDLKERIEFLCDSDNEGFEKNWEIRISEKSIAFVVRKILMMI